MTIDYKTYEYEKIPDYELKGIFKLLNKSFPNTFSMVSLANDMYIKIVAKDRNKVCGIGVLDIDIIQDKALTLQILAVDEHYQRQGIASQILKKIKEYAKEHDRSTMILCCEKHNTNALNLYLDQNLHIKHFSNKINYYNLYTTTDDYSINMSSIIFELMNNKKHNNAQDYEQSLDEFIHTDKIENVYQYHITKKDAIKTILEDDLFPIVLSIIDGISTRQGIASICAKCDDIINTHPYAPIINGKEYNITVDDLKNIKNILQNLCFMLTEQEIINNNSPIYEEESADM